MTAPALDDPALQQASHWLAGRDPALAMVLERHGYPPLWARAPGFATLVYIILEQQVSLASAKAAFQRLEAHLNGNVTPALFSEIPDETLRGIGFSRQKTRYARLLAEAVLEGEIDLKNLHTLPDEAVRTELKRLKGIGDWTADIYLLMCLLRPDVLPQGDIALLEAYKRLNGLANRPDHASFTAGTLHWRPWRSVGARLLWHFYLCERRG